MPETSENRATARGRIGRLGMWSATHGRQVVVFWAVAAIGFGALLPSLEGSLSGAGWQATGSESVHARDAIQAADPSASSYALTVVVHAPGIYGKDPRFTAAVDRVEQTLRTDPAIDGVQSPAQTGRISPDGHTAVIVGGAGRDTTEMVRAADRLRDRVRAAAGPAATADITGLAAQWADFNKHTKEEMLKSEVVSWPIILVVLVLAFGSLVAAGLPLLITLLGIAIAGGVLVLLTAVTDISMWSANFVLVFTLALGLDYALFVVMRFREALREGLDPTSAAATAMDSAGTAVLFSGITVLVSLSASFLISSPMPRSISLGIVLSVALVLAVVLTVLPLVLARLGTSIDRASLPWSHPSSHVRGPGRLAHWGAFVCRHPRKLATVALAALLLLSLPLAHLKIGIPGQKVLPHDVPSRQGYERLHRDFGPQAVAPVTVSVPRERAQQALTVLRADPRLAGARALPPTGAQPSTVILQASLRSGATSNAAGATIDRVRAALPAGALVGAGPAELHDFKQEMMSVSPTVIGIILVLGFLLLLIAVRAPLIALAGTVTSLLSTGAAFGVTVLVFQDGHLSGLLGFEPQGFVDFWGPVFFFGMIFAIAMDYTIFLVSTAREQWDRDHDAHNAIVMGMGRSGPVIIAAAGAMLAVYGTFAASGSLPAKEMGTILGMAVLLDGLLIRLLLLPAILSIAGERAWWEPALLRRILPALHASHDRRPSRPAAASRTR